MTKSKKLNILKLIGGISLVAIPAVVVPSVMLTSCAESAISVKSQFATVNCDDSATLTSKIVLTAKDAISDTTQGAFSVLSAHIGNIDVSGKGISFVVGAWVDNTVTIDATVVPSTLATTINNAEKSTKTVSVVIEYSTRETQPDKTSINVNLKIENLPAK